MNLRPIFFLLFFQDSLRDPLRGSLCSPAGKTSDPTSLAYQYETRPYFWGPMGHLKHFGGPKGDLWGTSEALWGTYGALQGTYGALYRLSEILRPFGRHMTHV